MDSWVNSSEEYENLFGVKSGVTYLNPDYKFTEEQFNFIVSNPLCIMCSSVLEWDESPQGSKFWGEEYDYIEEHNHLSQRGVQALKKLSNLTSKPKKPIKWV